MHAQKNDVKKVFWKCGACSHTFFYLLNREFGHLKGTEEMASDLLAGGLSNTGRQCGMLWGSALAVGAESFRRHGNSGYAVTAAISTTQNILQSFINRTKTADCRSITRCDLTKASGLTKLMLQTILGGFVNSRCFNLAEKWAPEAIQSAKTGLTDKQQDSNEKTVSCASEAARKMGASDEEQIMVAGFAGGMGLSGNACGALGAAIWMKALAWCRNHPGKTPRYFNNSDSKKVFKAFYNATGSEILCGKICGRQFKTIDEHTEFVKSGGCEKIINALAGS